MRVFDPNDLHDDIPETIFRPLASLALRWPLIEIGLTEWMSRAYGVRVSEMMILVGRMDTRARINKLKALYVHRNDEAKVEFLKALEKQHEKQAKTRNIIAHNICIGVSKADATRFYFLMNAAAPSVHGHTKIEAVSLADITAAADFAVEAGQSLKPHIDTLPAIS